MLLDDSDETVEIVEGYQTVFVFLYVAQQEEIIFQQFLIVHDVEFPPTRVKGLLIIVILLGLL